MRGSAREPEVIIQWEVLLGGEVVRQERGYPESEVDYHLADLRGYAEVTVLGVVRPPPGVVFALHLPFGCDRGPGCAEGHGNKHHVGYGGGCGSRAGRGYGRGRGGWSRPVDAGARLRARLRAGFWARVRCPAEENMKYRLHVDFGRPWVNGEGFAAGRGTGGIGRAYGWGGSGGIGFAKGYGAGGGSVRGFGSVEGRGNLKRRPGVVFRDKGKTCV